MINAPLHPPGSNPTHPVHGSEMTREVAARRGGSRLRSARRPGSLLALAVVLAVVPGRVGAEDAQASLPGGEFSLEALPPRPQAAGEEGTHRHTVFLNFAGGTLKAGGNAAEMKAVCLGPGEFQIPAYAGSAADQQMIVDYVRDRVKAFGLRVVAEAPPKHLPFSQVMLGGHSSDAGFSEPGLPGIPGSPIIYSEFCVTDCGDANRRETGFVFTAEFPDASPLMAANSALWVLGHYWGLDALTNSSALMNGSLSEDVREWVTYCKALDQGAGVQCPSSHQAFCEPNLQNDSAELTAAFGANSSDDVAPTVTLLAPADSAVLEPGAKFLIEAEVSDNFGGVGWHLVIPELDQDVPAYAGETQWNVALPKGVYTIRVEALDHDRNVGAAEATVYVGVEPPSNDDSTGEEPTGGESSGGGSSGGGASGEGSSGTDSTGDTLASDSDGDGDAADLEDPAGCACDSRQGGSGGTLALLGLLGLFTRIGRSRRRAARP